jgi:hypothetical protein
MRWAAALAAALGVPGLAAAQEVVWRAVARTPEPPAVVARAQAAPTGSPVATLGRPVPLAAPGVQPVQRQCVAKAAGTVVAGRPLPLVRAQAADPEPPDPLLAPFNPPPPTADTAVPPPPGSDTDAKIAPTAGTAPLQPPVADLLGAPTTHTASQPPDPGPPSSSPFPPAPDVAPSLINDQPVAPSFWEKCRNWLTWGDRGSVAGHSWFQSDHCFDCLISPITQPFYFEDPRALTEVRPIFIYQHIPSSAPVGGGSVYFFGTQGRVAFTDRLSLVLNELGFVTLDPKNTIPGVVGRDTGFAEIKLGPKYTFLRNTDSGTVAAAGLTFEVPAGSRKVFQDTGSLGLNPYVSLGQTFGRLPGGFGTVNFLGTVGYDFAVDSQRSEFLHTHLHLDYNVANIGLFPLIEMNWIRYTKSGKNVNFGTEGADLINFGSETRRGRDFVSFAAGVRYRFTDCIIGGAAIEFPTSRENGLDRYRLTFDVIFRY